MLGAYTTVLLLIFCVLALVSVAARKRRRAGEPQVREHPALASLHDNVAADGDAERAWRQVKPTRPIEIVDIEKIRAAGL